MTFDLLLGPRVVARGTLKQILDIGVERRLIAEERYRARRTLDEVVRHTLKLGMSVRIVAISPPA